jgi:hypothetical protein
MEIVAGEIACYRILAYVSLKMELHWRSDPVGKVRKNLPFFKELTYEYFTQFYTKFYTKNLTVPVSFVNIKTSSYQFISSNICGNTTQVVSRVFGIGLSYG